MNKYQKIRVIFFVGMFCAGFITLIGERGNSIFYLIGIVMAVAICIYENKNYRCPSCNKHFNIRSAVPDFCPKCGKKLL